MGSQFKVRIWQDPKILGQPEALIQVKIVEFVHIADQMQACRMANRPDSDQTAPGEQCHSDMSLLCLQLQTPD